MIFLLPQNPLESWNPDYGFEEEYEAIKLAGGKVQLIGLDLFLSGGQTWSHVIPKLDPIQDVIYRGWMLTYDQYSAMFWALLARGYRLINLPDMYSSIHYFPYAYDRSKTLREHSPKCTFVKGREFDPAEIERKLDGKAYIVKDYVKSAKGVDNAMLVADASNHELARTVVENMLKSRDMYGFNVGIVFKEWISFIRDEKENIDEYRAFVYKGQVVSNSPNSHCINHILSHMGEPVPEFVTNIAEEIDSQFFTVDYARAKDGKYYVIEVGDGGVSGLATGNNALEFYVKLMSVV